MKHVKTETGGSLVVWNDEYKGRFIAFRHRFDAGQQRIEKEKEKEKKKRIEETRNIQLNNIKTNLDES
jgi:hypothetical protein